MNDMEWAEGYGKNITKRKFVSERGGKWKDNCLEANATLYTTLRGACGLAFLS